MRLFYLIDLRFSVAPVAPPVPVYDKSGVTLTVSCEKQSATGLTVTLTASNATDADISSFTLQAAVPKVGLPSCGQTAGRRFTATRMFQFDWRLPV